MDENAHSDIKCRHTFDPDSSTHVPNRLLCVACAARRRAAYATMDSAYNQLKTLSVCPNPSVVCAVPCRAAYATMDSAYNQLKTLMEEVEAARDENVSKYSSSLEEGIEAVNKEVKEIRNAAQAEMVLSVDSEHGSVVKFLSGLKEQVRGHPCEGCATGAQQGGHSPVRAQGAGAGVPV